MIRTLKILLIYTAILLSGCSESEEEVPSDLIDRETFVQILADLHLAETELVVRNMGGAEVLKLAPGFYKQSFEKYNVDKESFVKTFDHYCYHTEEFEKVYELVVVELSERQAKLSE